MDADDIRWLQKILLDDHAGEVPPYVKSRLVQKSLVRERPDGASLTRKGHRILAEHFKCLGMDGRP